METKKYLRGEYRAINEDERSVEFVISDETEDRHGTILKADRWELENYKKNPIVGYMHNVWGDSFFTDPSPDMVIGRADVYQDGNQLIGKVYFEPADINEMADKIFKKVQFGSLRATSVGFIETRDGETITVKDAVGEREIYVYGGQELAEFSIVNIPSNPNAVRRSVQDAYKGQVDKIRALLGDDLTDEDIKKLTLTGLISILTGEKESPKQDDELETIQAQIQLRRMRLELAKRK